MNNSILSSIIRKRIDSARRRIAQQYDFFTVLFSRIFQKLPSAPSYTDKPVISLITVSYNTLNYLKLLLLTMQRTGISKNLKSIVIVDNNSADNTWAFLEKIKSNNRVVPVLNKYHTNHAAGLRCGIRALIDTEKNLPAQKKSNLFLIVDVDIIFLRPDLIEKLTGALTNADAALIGEIQYDVGEPYVHPSCMLLRADAYFNHSVLPFINNGAPALFLQRSMRKSGLIIHDFPVRKDNYIIHKGRGAIEGIRRFSPMNAYASANPLSHYHGNPDGNKIWEQVEKELSAFFTDNGGRNESNNFLIRNL